MVLSIGLCSQRIRRIIIVVTGISHRLVMVRSTVICNSLGDDTIQSVYAYEVNSGILPNHMIPFHDVGDGSYLCFSKNDYDSVYYIDSYVAEETHTSFILWLCDEFNSFMD